MSSAGVHSVFETAELGQKVSDRIFREREPELRAALLQAQWELSRTNVPLLVLFSGVDGAGKGECANILNAWMDARGIETHAYDPPTGAESDRPAFWRFWRDLPRGGTMGIFLSAWYSAPFLKHVYGELADAEYQHWLDDVEAFEQTLVDDGAVILKFWMHLGKEEQKERFEHLEADPLWSWRVTEKDWKHWRMYDRFVEAAERLLLRTSTGSAPWTIVEGADANFRTLEVAGHVLEGLRRGVRNSQDGERRADAAPAPEPRETSTGPQTSEKVTVLSRLDMGVRAPKTKYKERLPQLQGRLNKLYRRARAEGRSTVLVFEGSDAAGKGGTIRRLLPALDARHYDVIRVAAPTDEERARHYLWRFWRRLPRAAGVAIFDRSWYGRVLVERVEGFATEEAWRRAYAEINDFERRLTEHGTVVVKFWLTITPEEQKERFEARENIPYKQYKLTEEDWRNRQKWSAYEDAVNEMVERTSALDARWTLVPANDKRFARIMVLETVCDAIERVVGEPQAEQELAGPPDSEAP